MSIKQRAQREGLKRVGDLATLNVRLRRAAAKRKYRATLKANLERAQEMLKP